MTLALEAVVKQLTDSGIVAQGKLENFVPPKAHPKNVEELVRELVKENCLTKFQAQAVAAGKAKSLILGSYTLLDRIGAGGMGQVFKAEHRRMKRQVAIKMLPPTMTKDAAALARFQREVEAAAKLNHTHIVTAYDADQAGNAHFLVMEYVEGSDLSALVKKGGPLSVEKAVSYILQAARGLEFAHKRGVIHRDIKPANLLLDSEGTVKILDMGLARIESGGNSPTQAELTGTGAVMGTVDYMAPEQAKDTHRADARADIYSLGCSLYYLLAGEAIYGGNTLIEKLLAHQGNPVPELRSARPDVPEQLEAVYQRMVAKDVDERYQTMSDVIADLSSVLPSPLAGDGSGVRGLSNSIGSNSNLSFLKEEAANTIHRRGSKSTKVEVKPKAEAGARSNKPLLIGGGVLAAVLLVAIGLKSLLPLGVSARRADEGSADAIALRSSVTPPLAVAPFDAQQARAHQAAWANYLRTQVETTNITGMRMTLIPPGEFLMGSTPEQVAAAKKMGEDDKIRPDDNYYKSIPGEMPQHLVRIRQPFLISTTEVTVAQFRQFVEASQYVTEAEKAGFGDGEGDQQAFAKLQEGKQKATQGLTWRSPKRAPIPEDVPVTQVTWNDALAFCSWLTEQEHRQPAFQPGSSGERTVSMQADGYRLPTEAEWEYACRAGTTTHFSFGDDQSQLEQHAWLGKEWQQKMRPVALKLPNPFGLFDMYGNALEWCQDNYDLKSYEKSPSDDPIVIARYTSRVARGGYLFRQTADARSAYRSVRSLTTSRSFDLGFRIVRRLNVTPPGAAVAGTVTPGTASSKLYLDDPAFPEWMKQVQKMPAEDQITAVSKKLVELNPGFDGKMTNAAGIDSPTIENGVVTQLGLYSLKLTDISPIRAFVGLKVLLINGSGPGNAQLKDLSPLRGMGLTSLRLVKNPVAGLASLQEAMPGCKIDANNQAQAPNAAAAPPAAVDLLAQIDLKRDQLAGNWKLEPGALISADTECVLNLPFQPPAEYQLTLTAQRLGGAEGLIAGLRVNGMPLQAEVDGYRATASGFQKVDGQDVLRSNHHFKGTLLGEGDVHTILCRVQQGGAELVVDGIVRASAPQGAPFSLSGPVSSYRPAPLFLLTRSPFRITKLEIQPIGSAPTQELPARFPPNSSCTIRPSMRWLLYSQRGSSIPPEFLTLMVVWLAITFGSYGLFAPRNCHNPDGAAPRQPGGVECSAVDPGTGSTVRRHLARPESTAS